MDISEMLEIFKALFAGNEPEKVKSTSFRKFQFSLSPKTPNSQKPSTTPDFSLAQLSNMIARHDFCKIHKQIFQNYIFVDLNLKSLHNIDYLCFLYFLRK